MRNKNTPFIETLWDHVFWVTPEGIAYAHERDAPENEELLRTKHWGRWHTCAKCHEADIEGVRRNVLNLRGWLVYGPIFVLVVIGLLSIRGGK